METNTTRDDDDEGAASAKLIPEWGVSADDQVLFAGLAVVAILALLLGWNAWRGDDGSTELTPAVITDEIASAGTTPTTVADAAVTPVTEPEPESEEAATTTTTVADTTTTAVAAPVIGDVQAAVAPFPGDITGSNDGEVAVLTGYVANEAESREAEAAAADVEGITSVDNRLVLLEPSVLDAIRSAGVTQAGAAGEGTIVTVRGTISAESDREAALSAAAAVDGVADVVDALELSVTADLNELPQVQFATASAEILPASFADLDAAAELLIGAGEVNVEVQGYTDTRGSEERNLQLSQDRADAVRTYLVGKGVEAGILSATGFGETEQFGPNFEDNRLVRFQEVDG